MKRLSATLLASLALSGVATANDAAAPELGRLFNSAERRLQLERQRQLNVLKVRSLGGETLSLDGIVTRSGGKSTIWINRQAQHEGEAEQTGVAVVPDLKQNGRARLVSGDDGKPTELRVGESINRATGERNDRLGGGSVTVPGKHH